MTLKIRDLSLCFTLVVILLASVQASSVTFGKPIRAKVTKATLVNEKENTWTITARLQQEPHVASSGYYDATQYKLGSSIKSKVKRSNRSFKAGEDITVRWRSYSGMGKDGPVGSLSWEVMK